MHKRSDSFFKGHDNTQLYIQKWEAPNPKALLLVTHGQGEHSECYHRLVSAFPDYSFIAWDIRGHGRSEGLRGYAKDFDDYILDFHIFLNHCLNLYADSKVPLMLVAHSMGALIQTCALKEKQYPLIKAQILSSPLFGVSIAVPEWKDAASNLVNQFLPKITLGNEIKNEQLTRDHDVIKEYEKDTYRHNKISASVYLGFKREFQKVNSYAAEINIPTLLHISDNDPIVSSSAALTFFEQLKSDKKELKIFENGRHELYNDTCRNDVFKVVHAFCERFI